LGGGLLGKPGLVSRDGSARVFFDCCGFSIRRGESVGKIIERVRDRSKADKAEGCVVMGLNVRQVAYIKAKHAQETGEAVPPGLKGLRTIRFWWMEQGRRFPTQQVTKEIMGEHELDMAWAKDAFVVAMLDSKFPPVYPFVPGSWVTPEACEAIAKKQLDADPRPQLLQQLAKFVRASVNPQRDKPAAQ
jgi:hypothetical protein